VRFLLATLIALMTEKGFAQNPPGDQALRFRTVDIYVDAGSAPLAAYQLEFTANGADAKIVGIEGGEHPAFAQAPFYDPKAMQRERAILAAFSTKPAADLPSGRTRVATIHLQARGATPPKLDVRLETAADAVGRKFSPGVTVEERKQQ
jgi:hypothetical protein